MKALQAYSANDLEVLLVITPKQFTSGTESDIHKRFAKYRLHGEWFEYSAEIKDFVKQMCKEGA
jgi:hypothetical protein